MTGRSVLSVSIGAVHVSFMNCVHRTLCTCVFVGEREESEIGEDGVFVLELQRTACGLGLMLVDGEVSESRRY